MISTSILITGATGNVGYEVTKQLGAAGVPVRVALRSEKSRAKLPDPSLPWVPLDFADPTTYAPALATVRRLFLMRPPHISDVAQFLFPVIDAALAEGVEQITFLSVSGAEKLSFIPHAKVEAYLQQVNAPYTLIRAGFFNQNLNTTHATDIREQNDLFIPAGRGKTAFIDVRDIAAVIVRTLLEDGHQGKAYTLTGAQAVDMFAVAEMMSDVLKRPIRYSNPSPLRFLWRLYRAGNPLGYAFTVTMIYMSTRFGQAEQVTDDVQALLGRSPISLRQYIEDYADVWRPSSNIITRA